MTGGRASAVFGEALCLPARSRFGEGRAAPLSVSLQKRNTLEAISRLRRPGYPFV
jgi:hypothetical protein